jgi:hypothetical protein
MSKQQQERKVFMIRRKKDGLFSNGGSRPSFNTRGKQWSRVGDVKSHLTNVYDNSYVNGIRVWNSQLQTYELKLENFFRTTNPYLDCEVIEAEVIAKSSEDVYPFLVKHLKKKEKK